jgi:hypothetical protein
MRKLHALVALLVVLGGSAVARAQTSVAVLGFEPIEVPEDVAVQVTQALRARAIQARLRVLPGKPLVEMKLVFGCLDEAPGCMSQIGTSLGARKLLYGAVRKSRVGYAVTIKLLDAARGRIENQQTYQLSRADARDPALIRGHVDEWFVAVTGIQSTGKLRVTASVAGAKVFIDDRPIGTVAGPERVVIVSVPPGRHDVAVEARNYQRFTAVVRVSPGETLEVSAYLEREAGHGLPGPTGPSGVVAPTGPTPGGGGESPGRLSRIAFWSTAAAAVATFAVAGYAAWKVGDLGDSKLAQMQADCVADPYGPSCLRYIPSCGDSTAGEACRYNVPGNDACAAAGSRDPLTGLPRNSRVADACSDGKSWATATWVLFPIAGAFTAAAGYFFWTGYISKGTAEKDKSTSARLRLRLEPVVGPGLTAISASLRF